MSKSNGTTNRKPSGARINRGDKARVLFEQGTVYRVEVNPTGWIFCSCPDWARQYEASHDQALTCCKAIKASVRPVTPARCPDCGVELVDGRCVGKEWIEKSRAVAA